MLSKNKIPKMMKIIRQVNKENSVIPISFLFPVSTNLSGYVDFR